MREMPRGPLIVAHRGASGYRPEHTLAAYELGIRMGADLVEPDVVITRDGVLVARHEGELSQTTDVAARPEFSQRRTSKVIDGERVSGWFCEDFTLEEVKTLRARARPGSRRHEHDGRFTIPTLQEIVDLTKVWAARLGRPVGICPELKNPAHFARLGLPLEPPLLSLLDGSQLSPESNPVLIQSFEAAPLRRLWASTGFPLVQLMDEPERRPFDPELRAGARTWRDLTAPSALAEIARYASAIGCAKRLILPVAPDGSLLAPTRLIPDAHRAGLQVFAWTFQDEPRALAPDYGGDPAREVERFFDLGVDGFITDHPDTAAAVLRRAPRGGEEPECT